MRGDLEVTTIAQIRRKLNSQHAFARDVMLIAAAEQLGGFPREHAAHDQLDSTALLHQLRANEALSLVERLGGHRLTLRRLGVSLALATLNDVGRCLLCRIGGLPDCRSEELLLFCRCL